jgi:hypothetical protein
MLISIIGILGDEDANPNWTFVVPTKDRLVRPENVIFVIETGKNTSQKSDGQIGGQRYILFLYMGPAMGHEV